jgi:hypothetical protein
MYVYHLITGELLATRPAQVVGGKEITVSTSATPVAPPSDIPDGHAARWTGETWETVEDHRRKTDANGSRQGGTPYWLPGDTHTSPARYMEELGPLPEGALLERPAAPPPTPDELEAQFSRMVAARLNAFAGARQYDDISAARLASLSTEFQADGAVAQTAYDATWTAAIALVPKIRNKELTPEQAVEQLPPLEWPAETSGDAMPN